MGQDKALLQLDGLPLLDRVAAVMRTVSDDLIVVGRGRVADDIPGAGPLGGLMTGLRRARHPRAYVVACDLPFLSADFLAYLASVAGSREAVIPRVHGRAQPLHAVYRPEVARVAARLLDSGERRMQALLGHLDVQWVEENEIDRFSLGRLSLRGVNTPQEWQEALAVAQEEKAASRNRHG